MSTSARPRRAPRRNSDLEKLVVAALEEMKAVNVKVLDVRAQTDVADAMIVASGNSDRHVRAIAQHVVDKARETRRRPLGVEGTHEGEWVLVDLQDVVVHVMLPRVREFYAIEQLWEGTDANGSAPGVAQSAQPPTPGTTAAAATAATARRAHPVRTARSRPRRALPAD